MSVKKSQTEIDRVIEDARRSRELREKTYRERALRLYPWVCGRCGREFSGKKLRELTVHHRDHNHDNNPPNGSNWELLCIYCHDNEHSRYLNQEWYDAETPGGDQEPTSAHKPFAGLDKLLENKKDSIRK